MDFVLFPPEVNSGLMYAGPGSAPMLAAAEAWESIAAELYSTANSYESVISGLTPGPWLGPSSAMMATAATSYLTWMSGTAGQAEQTATQVKAAAAAYEEAFAATVPPPVVAANRSQLMSLVATNLLGPEHRCDRGHRGAVRRDVGPGRGRDVWLCGFGGGGDAGDSVQPATAQHQFGRVGRPVERRRPSRSADRGVRAERGLERLRITFLGAISGKRRGVSTRRVVAAGFGRPGR